MRLKQLLVITLGILSILSTGCISITIPAPTAIPTDTPAPTSTPERGFEIREKDEPLSADPDLFQFSVTLIGKAIDVKTREEVTSAKVTFITRTGTYRFGSRYELTIPSGSVVRIVIEAPGYETIDLQIKPHVTRNATIQADIPTERSPRPEI